MGLNKINAGNVKMYNTTFQKIKTEQGRQNKKIKKISTLKIQRKKSEKKKLQENKVKEDMGEGNGRRIRLESKIWKVQNVKETTQSKLYTYTTTPTGKRKSFTSIERKKKLKTMKKQGK